MSKNKKITSLVILIAVVMGVFLLVDVGLAQRQLLKEAAGVSTIAKENIPTYAGQIIGTVLSLVSVLFFVLLVYAGVMWMISRGNEEMSSKALNIIFAAIIGIIIVLSSYTLVKFIFQSTTQAEKIYGYCCDRGDGIKKFIEEEELCIKLSGKDKTVTPIKEEGGGCK
jgi:hypothetical protein